MIRVIAIGCFLVTAIAFASSGARAVITEAQPPASTLTPKSEPQIRKPYVVGVEGKNQRFIVGGTDQGFRELKHLFLGSISGSTSISKCCDPTTNAKVSLHLASPLYVHMGREVIIIETVDMVWPKGRGTQEAYLVLNDRFALKPNQSSRSFALLSEWAREKGFQ